MDVKIANSHNWEPADIGSVYWFPPPCLPPVIPCSFAGWALWAHLSHPAVFLLFPRPASRATLIPLRPPSFPNSFPPLIHGGRCQGFHPGLLDFPTPTRLPLNLSLTGHYTPWTSTLVTLVLAAHSTPLQTTWWSSPTETEGRPTNGGRVERKEKNKIKKRRDPEEEQQRVRREGPRGSTIT